MQRLTAPPRQLLTDTAVTALLEAPTLTVSAGAELLNADLSVREDISDDLESGKVNRALYANVHGTCSLTLARLLAWGVDLVRPYMTLSDGVTTARFNVGVYCLTSPQRKVASTPETYEVNGFDRLYLLQREVGDTYRVAAGTTYLTAITSAVTAAGLSGVLLDSSAAATTLPADMVWPLLSAGESSGPTTWLRIVNDLLSAINYRSLWVDENGYYRGEPYVEPTARPVDWTFDADSPRTIVGEERTLEEDRWSVPNRWVFVRTNLGGDPPAAPVEGAGIYTVNDTADQAARGLIWTSVVTYDAASQDALVGLGTRRVAADKRVASTLKLTTGPFPIAGHADIYRYRDLAIGVERLVQLTQVTVDLTGGDTQMTVERVA